MPTTKTKAADRKSGETTPKPTDSDKFDELDADIDRQMRSLEKEAFALGRSLLRMRESKLYRAKFNSFQDYLDDRVGISRSYAYALADQSRILQMLDEKMSGTQDKLLPTSGNQIEIIRKLKEPSDQLRVWEDAIKLAGGKQPTPSDVAEAVKKRLAAQKKKKMKEEAVDAEIVETDADGASAGEDAVETQCGDDAEIGDGAGVKGGSEEEPVAELALEFDVTEADSAAANAIRPAGPVAFIRDPGVDGVPGWEDFELANGSVAAAVIAPDGIVAPGIVRDLLRQIGAQKVGAAQRTVCQLILLRICGAMNLSHRDDGGDDMTRALKYLVRSILGNLIVGS